MPPVSNRCRLTRVNGDGPLPSLHGHYPASSLLWSSPPLAGASVLSASRFEPLVPFPLASPSRFSRSVQEMLWGVRREQCIFGAGHESKEHPMAKQNDFSRSLIAFEQNNTLIAVIEMSLNSWLVAGIVPAVERQPLKKMSVDEE